jgi:hypothetical protein
MKISELTGVALDAAVAQCENMAVEYVDDGITRCLLLPTGGRFSPSSNWAQGGPIIEREGITVQTTDQKSYINQNKWVAYRVITLFTDEGEREYMHGPTPLIAAMRCYVASKLGDSL